MLGKTIADLETGDVFNPVSYLLAEQDVTEYAHGNQYGSEWHYSPAPPYDRVVRPPTMIHADKMKILEANCDMERRVANVHTDDARIHYEYHATHHSPAFVGEELVVTGGITERYEKRGGEYLHYWLRVETADGRLITTYEDRTLLSYKPKAGVS